MNTNTSTDPSSANHSAHQRAHNAATLSSTSSSSSSSTRRDLLGLTEGAGSPAAHPNLLVRWFIQYNPLFTASALCVLGGVLLLSKALCAAGNDDANVLLTLVLEAYQGLVIGVAALLYRRLLERRPAVFLGIIALVFLVDPTLQLSALAGEEAVVATVLWVVGFGVKLHALAWAFRLRLSWSARVLPIGAATVIALVPGLRLAGVGDDVLPILLAACVFVIGATAGAARMTVESRQALGDDGEVVFARIKNAAVAIGVAGVLYQSINAVLAIGPQALLPAIAAGLLVVVLFTRNEAVLWACVLLSLIGFVTQPGHHGALPLGLPLVCAALLWAARNHAPRVLAVAVLVGLTAVWISGPAFRTVPVGAVVVVIASLPLAWALWHRRGWSCGAVLVAVNAKAAAAVGLTSLAPSGPLQWGVVLVGAGFVLLPVGALLHRKLSRFVAAELARADAEAALAVHGAELGAEPGASTSAMAMAST